MKAITTGVGIDRLLWWFHQRLHSVRSTVGALAKPKACQSTTSLVARIQAQAEVRGSIHHRPIGRPALSSWVSIQFEHLGKV